MVCTNKPESQGKKDKKGSSIKEEKVSFVLMVCFFIFVIRFYRESGIYFKAVDIFGTLKSSYPGLPDLCKFTEIQ